MSHDYANHGVLNENHRVSAAFTREQLRHRAIFHPQSPVPAPGMPIDSEAEPGEAPGLIEPTLVEPASGPPPAA